MAADSAASETQRAVGGAQSERNGERQEQTPTGAGDAAGTAHLEALLFAAGAPLSIQEAARLLEVTPERTLALAARLNAELAECGRPLRVRTTAAGVQLVLDRAYEPLVRPVSPERSERLGPALLETLAIVAYRQPITVSAVEALRGVRSERTLTALVDRGLVAQIASGAYVTTPQFLVAFGLRSLEDLPPWPGSAEEGAKATQVP